MSMGIRIVSLSRFLFLATIVAGCGGGGGGGGGPAAVPPPADLVAPKVYVNPDDGTLLSFQTDTGESFTYYGRKDAAGSPQLITELEYLDAAQNRYRIGYGATGVPSSVADEHGTVIRFDFTPDATSVARVVGREAVVVETSSIAASVHMPGSDGEDVQFDTRLVPQQPMVVILDDGLAQVDQLEPEGNLTIRVRKCGEPATLQKQKPVVVDYRYSGSSLTTRYQAEPSRSEPGKYVGRIPVRPVDPAPEVLEGYCKQTATLVSLVCAAIAPPTGSGLEPLSLGAASAMCATLAVQVAATPVPGAQPASPLVGAACEAFFVAGIVTCGSKLAQSSDGNPDPIEGDNVLARMCNNVTEFSSWVDAATGADTAVIRASADFAGPGSSMFDPNLVGGTVETTGEISVPSAGPFPELLLSHSFPVLESLEFGPRPPDPSVGYTATAEFSCAEGSELSLLVQGDDGYGDAAFGTALTPGAILTLAVPPRAGEPTHDTFSVSAFHPGTQRRAGKTEAVALAAGAVAEPPPPPATAVTSDFNNAFSSNEGWDIGPKASGLTWNNCGPAEQRATGGNPAGFITHTEYCGSTYIFNEAWYFVAPSKFRGDRSDAYGGSLSFDMRSRYTPFGVPVTTPFVVLSGAGKYLFVRVGVDYSPPEEGWTHYRVPLSVVPGLNTWRVSTSRLLTQSDPATEAELRQVLGDLTDVRILGTFGRDSSSDLDNVVLGGD